MDQILEHALRLPAEERRQLAEQLIISLDGEPREDAEAAWRDEIGHRVQQMLDGQVEMIDGEAAHERLRAHLQALRSRR